MPPRRSLDKKEKLNFRLSPAEFEMLRALAVDYEGNLSYTLRRLIRAEVARKKKLP